MTTDDDIAIAFDEFDVDDLIDDPTLDAEVEQIRGEDDALRFHRWRHAVLARIEKFDAHRDAELARIQLFHSDRTAGLRRRLAALNTQIEAWQRAANVKTFPTRWSTSKLNAPRSHVELPELEEPAMIEWAISGGHLGLLKITPSLAHLGRLPTVETEDGVHVYVGEEGDEDGVDTREIVPGVVIVTPEQPTFTIK